MQYIYIVVILAIAIWTLYKERNFYNPVFLFCGMWAGAMSLSSLCLYGLKETSLYAYSLAFLGIICFCIGASFRNRFSIKTKKFKGINTGTDYRLNYTVLFIIYTPIIIVSAILAFSSISLILRGVPMDVIRTSYNKVDAGLVIDNNYIFVFENFVIEAGVFASVALIPIITTDKRSIQKYVLLFELLVLQFMFIFISGARSFLIMVAILFVVYLFMNKSLSERFKGYFNKIPKFLIIIIAVLGLLVAWYVTTQRKSDGRTAFYEIYRYISIAMPLFDVRLGMIDSGHEFLHGWGLLHGFLKAPFFLFRKLTHIPWPSGLTEAATQIAANNDYYWVGGGYMGRGGNVNSFVTLFYYFYMDFGIVGIILGSFAYGYISQSLYKKTVNNPNRRVQAFYLLLAIGLLFSFVRLHFTAHRYVNAFIILFFAFTESRTCYEKNELSHLGLSINRKYKEGSTSNEISD